MYICGLNSCVSIVGIMLLFEESIHIGMVRFSLSMMNKVVLFSISGILFFFFINLFEK